MGFVTDVAEAIALASISPQAAGETYNAGYAEAPTIMEWVAKIAGAMGVSLDVEVAEPGETVVLSDMADGANLAYPLVLDTDKIRRELGFAEPVSEGEALLQTIKWELAALKTDGNSAA